MLGSAASSSHNKQDDGDDKLDYDDDVEDMHTVKGKSNKESPSQEKVDEIEGVNLQIHSLKHTDNDGFKDQESLQSEKEPIKSEERAELADKEAEIHLKEEFNKEMNIKKESVTDDSRQRTDSNSSTQSQASTTTRANALLDSISTLKRWKNEKMRKN